MINIDRELDTPLYIQIHNQIVRQIEAEELAGGVRLVSTRDLSKQLGVGRNTVELAYQLLATEGYVINKLGSGYYVNKDAIKADGTPQQPKRSEEVHKIAYDLGGRLAENELFGKRYWRTCFMDALSELQGYTMLPMPQAQGELGLRECIAKGLVLYRGVRCAPEQVIVTTGLYNAVDIVANLFTEHIFSVVAENPTHSYCSKVFKKYGFDISYIDVIEDVADTRVLDSHRNVLLYIAPTHNFPTGIAMTEDAKKRLLQWVSTSNSYIIEDDFDSELFHKPNPPMAMQASDEHERVIHIGNFSFALSPAINIGYVILPKHLCPLYENFFENAECGVPMIVQYALRNYMRGEHLSRYVRQVREWCNKKSAMLVSELDKQFGDRVVIKSNGIGLYIGLEVRNGMSSRELVDAAESKGVTVMPIDAYYQGPKLPPKSTILLNFGGVRFGDIPKAVNRLHEAWFES